MLLLLVFASLEERDKFEYLYSRYKKLLLYKAYDVLKDYAQAEDAVSEAYIRVYKNLRKIADPASDKTIAFLVTIVKNVALTMRASALRRQAEEYDETAADRFNLEENVIAALSSQEIYAAIDSLEEELKGVFLLKYAYDYSNREISQLLAISEGNVRVRLFRGRKKLCALLNKEGSSL